MHGNYRPRNTTIIITRLAFERDYQPLLEIVGALAHNLLVRILEDIIPSDLNVHIPIATAHSWLRAEVDQLAAEIALVLWDCGIERQRGQGRIVPCRGI